MYLNNRWLKSNGSISNIFDRIYRRVLIAKRTGVQFFPPLCSEVRLSMYIVLVPLYSLGGPTAMHHSPNKVQNAHHPCFVLQILCDSSEFDILSEPDKSHAVFRDVAGLHRCIFQLLRNLFLEHLSDYYDLFLAEFTRLTGELGTVETSTSTVLPLKAQSAYENDDFIPTLAPLYTISEPIAPSNAMEKPVRDSAGSTPSSNAFYNAFCSHSPSPASARKATKVFSDSNTTLKRSQNLMEENSKLFTRNDDPSSESEASDVIIGAMVRRKASPVVDDLSAQSQYQPENDDDVSMSVNYNDYGNDERDAVIDDNDETDDGGRVTSKKRKYNYEISPARRLFDLVAEADDVSDAASDNRSAFITLRSTSVNGEEAAEEVPGEGGQDESLSPNPHIIASTWNLDNDFAAAAGVPSTSASRMSRLDSGTRAVKLHKDMLSGHSVVGQWDSKFIIATFANTSSLGESRKQGSSSSKRQDQEANRNRRLILLFDQHALDERLNFEKYQSQFLASTSRGMTVDTTPEWSTTISTGTMQLIRRAEDILRQWHFQYSISSSPQEDGGGEGDHGSKKGSYVVSLTETLQILEESLTINDFLEFVYYLHDQMHVLPMCALKPPAVTRILAFRSCHSAVRFGDHLSLEQCKDMVNQLPSTSFPFQCAHGRPSMVPMVEYVNDKRNHSIRPPSYKNIFDELAALDIRI